MLLRNRVAGWAGSNHPFFQKYKASPEKLTIDHLLTHRLVVRDPSNKTFPAQELFDFFITLYKIKYTKDISALPKLRKLFDKHTNLLIAIELNMKENSYLVKTTMSTTVL